MKKILMLLPIVISLLCLSGCQKCVSIDYETVSAKIVDEEHDDSYLMPMYVNNHLTYILYPSTNKIVVEYNDNKYSIYSYETYEKYCNSVGEYVEADFKVKTYEDGTKSYSLVSLQ